jgi:hypothetical protein
MTDGGKTDPGDAHRARVDEAFDAFLEGRRDRLDAPGHGLLDRMRGAAADRDAERLREHLSEAKERHGWLYRELAAHPELANLLDELALWGF